MKSSLPLYLEIQHKMIAKFSELPYYSLIPGERELSQMFDVSRPTVRKALENMEADNVIVRIHGRGTFYIGNKVPIDYSHQNSNGLGLFSILRSAGKITKSHVLQQVIEFPKSDVAANLKLKKNEMVFHLKRLRYVNDELYSLTDDFIPLKIYPNMMEIDFSNHSLMETFMENHIYPYKEDKNIEIRKADIQDAAYLKINEGDPISITTITTYDKNGNIIDYASSKADAYQSRFRITTLFSESESIE